MAIAVSIAHHGVLGNMRGNIVDVTLDGSYASGGYAITAADCGVASIQGFFAFMKTGEALVPMFDLPNLKLKILKGASTTTVTTGSGIFSELATNDSYASSTVIVRALVFGPSPTG